MASELLGEGGGAHALGRIERQGGPDDADDLFPAGLSDLGGDPGGGAAKDPLVPLLVARRRWRRLAGEQLDQQRAQPVGAGPGGVDAFGRRVAFGRGGGLLIGGHGPEARELDSTQRIDQQLLGGGAGVDDQHVAVRRGDGRGGGVDGRGRDGHDLDGRTERDGLVALLEEAGDVVEIDAVEVLHHKGRLAPKRGDMLDRQHVLVLDPGEELGLLTEGLQVVLFGGDVGERSDQDGVLAAVGLVKPASPDSGTPGTKSTHQLELCRGHVDFSSVAAPERPSRES